MISPFACHWQVSKKMPASKIHIQCSKFMVTGQSQGIDFNVPKKHTTATIHEQFFCNGIAVTWSFFSISEVANLSRFFHLSKRRGWPMVCPKHSPVQRWAVLEHNQKDTYDYTDHSILKLHFEWWRIHISCLNISEATSIHTLHAISMEDSAPILPSRDSAQKKPFSAPKWSHFAPSWNGLIGLANQLQKRWKWRSRAPFCIPILRCIPGKLLWKGKFEKQTHLGDRSEPSKLIFVYL